MPTFRRLLACVSLCAVASLAGCQALSSDYWKSPSILTKAPPDPEKPVRHETQGGFTVMVEAPGQPTSARVIADIGAFAQRRGFVPQAAGRYVLEKVTLDVFFRTSDSHVIASLHSAHLNRKLVEAFYHDFDHEFARQYGEVNPIIESDFLSDSPPPI